MNSSPQHSWAIKSVDLARSYPIPGSRDCAVDALKPTDLALPSGSLTAVVGPSGCGKTTLLQCLAGLDAPTRGQATLLGVAVTGMTRNQSAQFRARHVGFVFQKDNLISSLSTRDNIALPGRLRGTPLSREDVNQALDRVGLTSRSQQMPAQLSGGERQRAAIARILAARPEIVFADEPTASLDVGSGQEVMRWFIELARQGHTVMIVTHDVSIASQADTVLVMNSGDVVGHLNGGDPTALSHTLVGLSHSTRSTK